MEFCVCVVRRVRERWQRATRLSVRGGQLQQTENPLCPFPLRRQKQQRRQGSLPVPANIAPLFLFSSHARSRLQVISSCCQGRKSLWRQRGSENARLSGRRKAYTFPGVTERRDKGAEGKELRLAIVSQPSIVLREAAGDELHGLLSN